MHLLLVEDDLDLGAELQRALNHRGFTSEWVRSSAHAVALTDNHQDINAAAFSCAVLDLGLPDGDGISLLRYWRKRHNPLPVIVLTARDALESRVTGLESGADDYVVKPCATDEIVSRIRAVVRRSANQSSFRWHIGNLAIDTSDHEVTFNGTSVALSPTEYSVLIELARTPGRVVTKHRLARAVAPLSDPLEFSALEWHIHNLRRKLSQDLVRTIRGVGYCLSST